MRDGGSFCLLHSFPGLYCPVGEANHRGAYPTEAEGCNEASRRVEQQLLSGLYDQLWVLAITDCVQKYTEADEARVATSEPVFHV